MFCICPVYVLYMCVCNLHEQGKVNDNRFVKNWYEDEVSR
jgi:hypothetical protein